MISEISPIQKSSSKSAPSFGAFTALTAAFILTLLASCGGGGGGGGGSRTEPAPTVTRLTHTPAEPWRNGVVTFETQCIGSGTLSYEWDLGDGIRDTTTNPSISHSYYAGGPKRVSVTCTDSTRQRTSLGLTVAIDPMDLTSVANRTCSTGRQGRGWCVQNPLPTAVNLNSIVAVNRVTAWAVGSFGAILKTINGGTNWTAQSSGTTNPLYAITAVDSVTAWAVGGEY